VVDDGSDDGTSKLMERVRDRRIRLLGWADNRGQSAARNLAIEHARGRFTAFLDSDDRWMPRLLERQLEKLADYRSATGVSVCGRRKIDSLGSVVRTVLPGVQGCVFEETLGLQWVPSTVTLMVRTDLLRRHGFDERLKTLEELDVAIRLSKVTRFTSVEEVLVEISEHDEPRVSASGLEASAWTLLLAKHQRDLVERPRVLGLYHYRAFLAFQRQGDFPSARQHLSNAWKCDPTDLRRLVRLAAMAPGEHAYHWLRSLAGRR